jgi:hypothetical protein
MLSLPTTAEKPKLGTDQTLLTHHGSNGNRLLHFLGIEKV